MDAHHGDPGCQTQEFHCSEGDGTQNPGKLNIEIFELDANNSFTMQLDGEGSGIFHDNILQDQQGRLSERTRSTSTCLSTPTSELQVDPTFQDFNLKKIIGETDSIRQEIKLALSKPRLQNPTLALSQVKMNMKLLAKNYSKRNSKKNNL